MYLLKLVFELIFPYLLLLGAGAAGVSILDDTSHVFYSPSKWIFVHIISSVLTYALVSLSAIVSLSGYLSQRSLKSKQNNCGHLHWISGLFHQHNGPGILPYSIISSIGVQESKKYRQNYMHMHFKSIHKFSNVIVWKKLSCKEVLDICVWGGKVTCQFCKLFNFERRSATRMTL